MKLPNLFKNNKKETIIRLENELNSLKNDLTDINKLTLLEIQVKIATGKEKLTELRTRENELDQSINDKKKNIRELDSKLVSISDELEMEQFSLYRPKYTFSTAIGYKDRLIDIRNNQKQMIKSKTAVNYFDNWTVDGSKSKGKKMTNDNIRLIIRSFNNECEAAINKVKFSNIESIEKRIINSYEQLNKLNSSSKVSLSKSFLQLKKDELYLAFEYERKKQEEKEELREQRERDREEKKLQQEIESKKKFLNKDISHYSQMVEELLRKINSGENEDQRDSLNKEIMDLQKKIKEKEAEKTELDYREAHSSAGYVYIISNIGAFGEDTVKIGVTRRLNPYERIAELSSASVPFPFDIHAIIFSYEAYQLENTLHKRFDSQRINKINSRKEFFKVTIDEIKDTLEEYKDLTIDFTELPDAEEYRETKKLDISHTD
ncbi:DUF4041 domain-containing protein [Alkalibacterium olivapovliticus]|uniref:T5orf172 domain-containing protein n=1 Tax=Alkalibacterium olivapovliticus TaxID=99907 RepID=A0A2T0W2B0_9LACT|nr:DUF4041 domain-containing protein [Alkalibacterium olivapovliticus]PRY79320.1 T5orf172 domain-containing protein [Alkalibacterium olivapovliticus]